MSNLLSGSRAYLAGNLEYTEDNFEHGWRQRIGGELRKLSVTVLDPTDIVFKGQPIEKREELKRLRGEGKFDEVAEYMKEVVRKDLRQIDVSDFIIVNWNIDVPTFGTPHELTIALQQKKPIFLAVGDKLRTPLWFFGTLPHKYIYNNTEEILEMVKKIDSEEVEIDSDRWRILSEELK